MERIYSIFVDNKPGVLDRVVGLIRRYGWNILSLVAADADDRGHSIITMAVSCASEIRMPDSKIEELDFVHSVSIRRGGDEDLFEFFVASGKKDAFGDLAETALRTVPGGDEMTAYWAGSAEEITALQKKLASKPGFRTARTGAVVLLEKPEVME